MNTDKKMPCFLSVFICVHPWLIRFAFCGVVAQLDSLAHRNCGATSGVRSLDPAGKSACATKTASHHIPRHQEFGDFIRTRKASSRQSREFELYFDRQFPFPAMHIRA
jgi:hypothetical protein